jgi:hypothetical protein
MSVPAKLAIGEHLLLADPATEWAIEFLDIQPPSVQLTASISTGPGLPMFPAPVGTTSVAVQMDARVAIELYEKLGDLIRSMGWQQHITGGRPI